MILDSQSTSVYVPREPKRVAERFNRPTRRTRAQAKHDAQARLSGRTGWIIQHSHPARHVLRGLMSISRSSKGIGAKTVATSKLLRVDLVTARMMIQDAPVVRKHRGPALDRVAEAERIEAQRAESTGFFVEPHRSRRDIRIMHAKAAKARLREAGAVVTR